MSTRRIYLEGLKETDENADKKIKISSKPNAVTIEAIKEVQQMKSGAVTDKTSYDDVDKMISDILDS